MGTMKRRGFFKTLAGIVGGLAVSPMVFIPKFEPIPWKIVKRGPWPISCAAFTQFLIDQQPHYDAEILKDIEPLDTWDHGLESIIKDIGPTDGWTAHVDSGLFLPRNDLENIFNRFRRNGLI